MSVAVERRTVSLWPVDASPVKPSPPSSRPPRPRQESVVPSPVRAQDRAARALAAITSSYRDGRAGIISGDPSPAARRLDEPPTAAPAPSTHLPTVPLPFLSATPAVVLAAVPDVESPEATTLWSRLRSRRPAARGRHSPKS